MVGTESVDVARTNHAADSEWIATVSPDLAEPLAQWLEDAEDEHGEVNPYAAAVAQHINRAQR